MDETTALRKFDRLAHKVAAFYYNRYNGMYDRDDLYQSARIGIVSAARTYDPEIGCEFITHAYTCANNAVKKHIRDDRGLIKVPQTAEGVQLTVVSSETAETLLEFEAAPDDNDAAEKSIVLAEAMSAIPERQRVAIQLVYLEGKTYEEAADALSVSKQYAHQLTSRGLASLRQADRKSVV